MRDLGAELAYFRHRVVKWEGRTRATLQRLVAENSPFKNLTDDEQDWILRELEAAFDITQEKGAALKDKVEPWLDDRRGTIRFYYWERLRDYFIDGPQKERLEPRVVSVLDADTDEILDFTGNPADEEPWKRRGMVLGHVQSGKTTNYAALICKAADAGYKVIILLAGMTNLLREQTQERMDDYFIGKKSFFQIDPEDLDIVRFGRGIRKFPAFGTSRDRDFSKGGPPLGVNLAALTEPIIFVTKKNKSILENLAEWLETHHPQPGAKIQYPLLLIDDEADNASVNTSKNEDKVTAINKAIRGLLARFERSTYVGYTATPFANIFIDPASVDDMLEDDLFPANFIKALDPPSSYVGAGRMFAEGGDLTRSVIEVGDYQDLLPLKHKIDHQLEELPDSLLHALRLFVLARAVRVLRGQGQKHCSMLINVSRFNDVQERVEGLVYKYLNQLRDAITVNAARGARALEDPDIQALADSFADKESGYSCLKGIDFLTLLPKLFDGVSTVKVVTVNRKSPKGTLNYRKNQNSGLHVIAVGGLALSRGLTLEGLTASYILRNTGASDTLMQMARWFGFRPGYADLVRLHLPSIAREDYKYITDAIEELRGELGRMQVLNRTPATFGLKVRQSPAAIRITAANKMRSAADVTLAQDYSCRVIEGYALKHDAAANTANVQRVHDFLKGLDGRRIETPPRSRDEVWTTKYSGLLMWSGVSGAEVMVLLRQFEFSEQHPELGFITGSTSLFADYISDRHQTELKEWDVAVPAYQTKPDTPSFTIASTPRRLVRRSTGVVEGSTYKSTASRKAAGPFDHQIGLTGDQVIRATALEDKGARRFCLVRERPLLLIHLFDVTGAERSYDFRGPAVATLSFCMPATSEPIVARTYSVTTTYRQQMLELAPRHEDDDQEEDDR